MRIKEIDIMKCLAILGIIMVHTAQKFKGIPEDLSMIFYFGQMGVQIFFMFSAYSLCLSKDSTRGFIKKNYYIKRILRIVPGYWIGIVIYELAFLVVSIVGLPTVLATNRNPFAIIINMLLLNNLFVEGNNNVVPGGWSISCLWLFYLIFPFIWLGLSKLKKDKFKIIVLSISILLVPVVFALLYLLSNGQIIVENNSFLYFFIGNQITSFLMGVLLFIGEKMVKNKKSVNILLTILAIIFVGAAFLLFAKGYWWSYFTVTVLVSAGAACIYMLLRRCDFNYPNILIQMGKRTYSMFLLHFIFAYYGVSYIRKILVHAGIEGKSVGAFIVGYILVVALSYITGGWLEKLMNLPTKWYKKVNN